MPTDPDRPWETPDEQAAKQPPAPDTRPWAQRHWIALAIAAVIVGIVGWSALDANRESGRKDAGYSECREAIEAQLIGDYSPEIAVTYEESLTDGTLIYSARSDDGDGQWTCHVAKAGDPLEVEVTNGLWDD